VAGTSATLGWVNVDTPVKARAPDELPSPGSELYPARLAEGLHRVCLAAGGLTLLLGFAVLVGWAYDLEPMKNLVHGSSTMKPNTALGFGASGTAILALALGHTRRAQGLSAVAAMVPVLAGTLTLAEYAFHRDLGIDQLLFRDPVPALYPGRMAPTTAACLVVLGASLLFAARGRGRVSARLVVASMLVGFLAVLGYLFGASALYRWSTYTSMALPTALGFLVASFGVRLLRPTGLVASSSTAGGVLVRHLVPQAIVALVALGWVRLLGERAGFYGTEMGLAITTAGAVFIVTALIQRTARSLHQVDLQRQRAEQALRAFNAELEDRVRERTAELAASEERLRSLAEASFEAVVVHEGGVIVEVNRVVTEMYGYEPDELIGQSGVDKLVAPEFRQLVREAIGTGNEGRWDVQALRKDGTRFWASGSARSVRYGDRLVRVAAIRDITHRKQVEEALRAALEQEHEAAQLLEAARDEALEASRLKSDFLTNMSHEIRTPMNVVIGMTGLLLDTSLTSEQHEFAAAVRAAGEALLEIINEILDFSKIEAGKVRIEPTDFELRLVVEEIVDLLALRAYEKGLELASLVDPGAPVIVRGDPGRLRQILTNLVSNAVKFTDRGEIMIRVTAADGRPPGGPAGDQLAGVPATGGVVRFEVTDTGIGIAAADQRHLFQSFQQVDSSPARRFGGTGLGLAVCKQLVELMGGEIGVRSEPGVGSTFWFTLPMAARETVPLPQSAEFPGVRVLVVDDNVMARGIVAEQLESWKVRAEGTASGVEALAVLRDAARSGEPFDVALVDWRMPRMDGPALAAAISADPAIAATRLVILTSGTHHDEPRGNVVAHLTKPIRESQLLACLARVVKGTAAVSLDPPPGGPGAREGGGGADALAPVRLLAGRLLVAEDNPVNQVVAVRMLERLGYQADVASNGAEALEAMSHADYAAVLMDCQMPELDGFEATRRIRKREAESRHTPVIAMTADAMHGDRERCAEAGMDDYVSKPIRPEQLAAVLRRWVAVSEMPV
jgi:PAS domain S-box-containing protein